MSGMVHPDMANFSSMAALNSVHNNSQAATGSGNKHNLKRRDKGSHQEDFNKSTSSKEVKWSTWQLIWMKLICDSFRLQKCRTPIKQFRTHQTCRRSSWLGRLQQLRWMQSKNQISNRTNRRKEKIRPAARCLRTNQFRSSSKPLQEEETMARTARQNRTTMAWSQPAIQGEFSCDSLNNDSQLFSLFPCSNSSLLGVRLPPDTEIIKYTSGSKKSCKFERTKLNS